MAAKENEPVVFYPGVPTHDAEGKPVSEDDQLKQARKQAKTASETEPTTEEQASATAVALSTPDPTVLDLSDIPDTAGRSDYSGEAAKAE